MALPSQTERSSSSSRVSASRSRGVSSKTIAMIAAVVVVAGGIGSIFYFKNQPGAGPALSNADTKGAPDKLTGSKPPSLPTSGDHKTLDPKLPASGASTPPAASPPPTSINQGSGPKPTVPTNSGAGGTNPAPATTPGGTPAEPPKSGSDKPTPVDVSNPAATPGVKSPEASDARPPAPATPLPASGSTQDVRTLISQGDDAVQKGNLVQARQLYSRALVNSSTAKSDQDAVRKKLATINDELLFSPKVTAGDPLTETYSIQSGDAISRLPRKRELAIDWRLIKRINKFSDDDLNRLKVGQKIKLVRGPFHAVVTKSDYRLDIFAGSPDEPENWVFIRSFAVGLGEGNATPVGSFIVKSRQVNPPWTNPKTGEKFAADDPKNPIGEYWLGWEGVGASAGYKGFGIHGTVDPSSIGQQKSMGCVRLLNEDVGMVYEMLTERISVVQVRP